MQIGTVGCGTVQLCSLEIMCGLQASEASIVPVESRGLAPVGSALSVLAGSKVLITIPSMTRCIRTVTSRVPLASLFLLGPLLHCAAGGAILLETVFGRLTCLCCHIVDTGGMALRVPRCPLSGLNPFLPGHVIDTSSLPHHNSV